MLLSRFSSPNLFALPSEFWPSPEKTFDYPRPWSAHESLPRRIKACRISQCISVCDCLHPLISPSFLSSSLPSSNGAIGLTALNSPHISLGQGKSTIRTSPFAHHQPCFRPCGSVRRVSLAGSTMTPSRPACSALAPPSLGFTWSNWTFSFFTPSEDAQDCTSGLYSSVLGAAVFTPSLSF